MEEFKQFIVSHYEFLILGVIALIELVVALIRKKSIVEIIDDSATSDLLKLVIEAEQKFGSGHGSEKLEYVLSMFFRSHASLVPYRNVVVNLIEHILSSPQKKG